MGSAILILGACYGLAAGTVMAARFVWRRVDWKRVDGDSRVAAGLSFLPRYPELAFWLWTGTGTKASDRDPAKGNERPPTTQPPSPPPPAFRLASTTPQSPLGGTRGEASSPRPGIAAAGGGGSTSVAAGCSSN